MIDQNKRVVLFAMWGTLHYEHYGYDSEEPSSLLNQLTEKVEVSLIARKHACSSGHRMSTLVSST